MNRDVTTTVEFTGSHLEDARRVADWYVNVGEVDR